MRPHFGTAALGAALLTFPAQALCAPSADLDTYALFAATRITAKGIALGSGNIGVNAGPMFVADFLDAPSSEVAADFVNVPASADCAQQFANTSLKASPGCPLAGAAPVPIVADVAAACGAPMPFPACDAAAPVVVPPGATALLPPGTYGHVKVARGGTLHLAGGTYQFCSVRVGRTGSIEIDAAVEVDVEGKFTVGSGAYFGPAQGSGLPFADVRVFANGTGAHFSRQSAVQARFCAPSAALRLTQGGSHVGTFIAASIRTERIQVVLPAVIQPCRDLGDEFCAGECPPDSTCQLIPDFGCGCR